jgi:putative transposase
MTENTPSPLGNVITIDDERIKSYLDRVVRGSVEETLNPLLDAEADRLCNAQRYERSEARRIPGRSLRTQAADQGLARSSSDIQAYGADVRDGDHRALPVRSRRP